MSFLASLGIGALSSLIPGIAGIIDPALAGQQAQGNQDLSKANTATAAGTIAQNLTNGQTNLASLYNNYKDPATQAGVTAPQIDPNSLTPVTAPTMSSVYGAKGLGSVPAAAAPAPVQSMSPYVQSLLASIFANGTGMPKAPAQAQPAAAAPQSAAPAPPTLSDDQKATIASAAALEANPTGQTDEQITGNMLNALQASGKFTPAEIAQATAALHGPGYQAGGQWGSGPGEVANWTNNMTAAMLAGGAGASGAYNNNAVPSGGQQTGATTAGYAPQGYAVNTPVATSQMAGIIPNTPTVAPPPLQIGSSQALASGGPSALPPAIATQPSAYRAALASQLPRALAA